MVIGKISLFETTQILFYVLNDIFLATPRSSFIIIDFLYIQFYSFCSAFPYQQQCNCCIMQASHHVSGRSLVANQQGLLHWCPA